jgi:hypothetical protein
MSRHFDTISKSKRSCIALCKDLSLLASLYLAHFIVWRTLRTRHKERMARLKNMRLINASGQASVNKKELMPVSMGERGRLREVVQDSGFRHRV